MLGNLTSGAGRGILNFLFNRLRLDLIQSAMKLGVNVGSRNGFGGRLEATGAAERIDWNIYGRFLPRPSILLHFGCVLCLHPSFGWASLVLFRFCWQDFSFCRNSGSVRWGRRVVPRRVSFHLPKDKAGA